MPSFSMQVTRTPGAGGGIAGASGKAKGGLRSSLALAAGLVHRHLMGLGRDHPPTNEQGVLPVWSGRLKNSFHPTPVQDQGNSLFSTVESNIEYGAKSNARHAFLERTVSDTQGQVNSLISSSVGNSLHG